MEKYFLDKLIINSELKDILDAFYQLTNIRVAYYSVDTFYGYSIAGNQAGISPFCTLVRSVPNGLKSCLSCDINARDIALNKKGINLYRCHMGLYEAIVPIFVNNCYCGFLMFGQVRGMDKKDDIIVISKRAQELKLDISSLMKEYELLPSLKPENIYAAAKMLSIFAKYIINNKIIQRKNREIIDKIDEYIIKNLEQPVTVRDLAAYVHLNAAYLSDLFKHLTGMKCIEYIHKIKLEKAREMLVVTDTSIGEIALKLGYSDQNYFSRLFKHYNGISPKQYRQNFQNKC